MLAGSRGYSKLRTAITFSKIQGGDQSRNKTISKLAFCSPGYVRETLNTAINSPSKAPKIAPDQGLAVTPQVLPAHMLKYPIAPPTTAPAATAMTYLIIIGIDLFPY